MPQALRAFKVTKKNPNGVNQKAFNAVADVIEYADRFDLATFVSGAEGDDPAVAEKVWDNCGTTACVAGWVAVWADAKPTKNAWGTMRLNFEEVSNRELGLTDDQGGRIYFNRYNSVWSDQAHRFGWSTDDGFGSYLSDSGEITAAQAATVLREIASGDIIL